MNFTKKVIGLVGKKEEVKQQESHLNLKTVNNKHVNSFYNKDQESFKKNVANSISQSEQKRLDQFELVLEQQIVDLDYLKKLSWEGIPDIYRGKVWKLLLKYVPPNHLSQASIVNKKRADYKQYIQDYFESMQESERDDTERKIIKIINADVIRTQPECPLFRHKKIQALLSRLLFIWNMRHPASGYVQGINDISSPFIAIFLNEYIPVNMKDFKVPLNIDDLSDEIFMQIEADTYWCLSKILEYIQDYYTNNQPGVSQALKRINELIKLVIIKEQTYFKIDPEFEQCLRDNTIELTHFAFRWVYCLLVREFPLSLAMRILDTYIADDEGFAQLHIYTCTNLMLKCAPDIKKMCCNEMIIFFQNLPTKGWNEFQVQMLLAEAYVFRCHYEKTKGHIKIQAFNPNHSFM